MIAQKESRLWRCFLVLNDFSHQRVQIGHSLVFEFTEKFFRGVRRCCRLSHGYTPSGYWLTAWGETLHAYIRRFKSFTAATPSQVYGLRHILIPFPCRGLRGRTVLISSAEITRRTCDRHMIADVSWRPLRAINRFIPETSWGAAPSVAQSRQRIRQIIPASLLAPPVTVSNTTCGGGPGLKRPW